MEFYKNCFFCSLSIELLENIGFFCEFFKSSDPGVHRKKVKKKNNARRTPEDCVMAPIFENTDSLTGGLLRVNDDNRVNQDDDRYILQILCL